MPPMPLSNTPEPESPENERDATADQIQALNSLFSAAYEELKRLARTVSSGEAGMTMNPTALVNETWLKPMKSPPFSAVSPLHFKRIAARAMRQVLVDAARRRNAHKRGGGEAAAGPLPDLAEQVYSEQDLLLLDEALQELERLQPRQALLVESRFFGGLDVEEAAALLDVSPATIQRDWRAAKAWLKHRVRQGR
jgi:RNA polymerase sigma factor (TIGR02999 family)